jgi:hypothetical protein
VPSVSACHLQKIPAMLRHDRDHHRALVPSDYREPLATRIIKHGLKANRATLDVAAKYSNQQSLTQRIMTMDELFAANALDS